MDRDPKINPLPLDVLFSPGAHGGVGARYLVTKLGSKRYSKSGPTPVVCCEVRSASGKRLEGRGRVYSLSRWPALMADAQVVATAEEAATL